MSVSTSEQETSEVSKHSVSPPFITRTIQESNQIGKEGWETADSQVGISLLLIKDSY